MDSRVRFRRMILLENKRLRFDYEIIDTYEAGMYLEGWEVKSIRAKHGNLKSAWVKIINGEVFLENFQVPPWPYASGEQNRDRSKKLLLKKSEIEKIQTKLNEKGRTVAPTKIFTSGKYLKCEIIVGKGRKKYEKRQVLKERSMDREAKKALKNY